MRRGSFAAAAREGGVEPSSVSRTIAGLERELGVRLFHRTTRRLSPTEAAVVYRERVEPLVAELDSARLSARDVLQRPTGTLRVAAPVSYGLVNVVPRLATFAAGHPGLSIDLTLTDATLDLIGERIDVALQLSPLSSDDLVARRLDVMDARVCASPAYLERRGRPVEPGDLEGHDCLLLDMPGFSDRWTFTQGVRSTGVTVSGPLRTSNALALAACARDGLGIILQATWIVAADLAAGRLVDLFPEHRVSAAGLDAPAIWVVHPSRDYVPQKVRAFSDFLVAGPPSL
jgi:DNA-binding transcriptional LysR family regulator